MLIARIVETVADITDDVCVSACVWHRRQSYYGSVNTMNNIENIMPLF